MDSEKLYTRIDQANKIFLLLIPFVISFSSAAVNIFFVLSFLTYTVKKITGRQSIFPHTGINIPFALIVLISLFSFFNSINIESSLRGMWKLFKYGFMFVMVADACRDKRFFKAIIISMMFGLFLASFDGIFQLITGKDLLRGRTCSLSINMRRIRGAFPDANVFGIYLGLLVPVALSISRYLFTRGKRILMLLFTALGILALTLTFSRGTGAGFLLAALFISIKKKDKAILGILAVVAVLFMLFIPSQIVDWFKNEPNIWTIIFNGDRLNMFRTSWEMIKAHPFIGVGVNTYLLNYPIYKIQETAYFTAPMVYAHNHYLHMASEIGILGLLSFFWLIFRLLKGWTASFRYLRDPFVSVASLGLVASVLAFLVNGMTETSLYYSKVAILFWFNLGLILAARMIADAERQNK